MVKIKFSKWLCKQKIKIKKSNLLCSSDADTESIIDFGLHCGNFLSLLALVGKHDNIYAQKVRHEFKKKNVLTTLDKIFLWKQ